MAKPNSQERRKQILKQRRAEDQRRWDQADARDLYHSAFAAHKKGDAPAAGRLLKKALVLDPDLADALRLLAEIHDGAGHYAEALGYLLRLRKLNGDPGVLYNLGVVYDQLKQPEKAADAMREFLAATHGSREPKWKRLRESAEAISRPARDRRPQQNPASPPTRPTSAGQPPQHHPVPLPPQPKPQTPPEPPRVGVQFFTAVAPGFASVAALTDYFLRRQWIDLRLAQSFEDLLCLPSLQGVDSYVYQQETVRKVLRHPPPSSHVSGRMVNG